MEALLYITYLAIIFLVGLLASIAASKFKLPNVLLLLLAGILMSMVTYKGEQAVNFPPVFMTSIGILALVMIVFDGSSRFNWKEFDTFSLRAIKLVVAFLFANMIFLSFFLMFIFKITSIYVALIFAVLMTATAPELVFFMMKESSGKIIDFLKVEAIVNTPIIVLLPFIIIDLQNSLATDASGFFLDNFVLQIAPFLQQIITGVGAGALIGVIIFKAMRTQYSETLSPLALIAAALLAYILAENLGGNGVLAVTTLGLFFGNIYIIGKKHMQEFSSLFSNFLEIIVFVMIGFLVKVPLNLSFFLLSLALFMYYLIIRFITIHFTFRENYFSLREKIFMTLNAPKGIAVATVTFLLATLAIPELSFMLDLLILMVFYSIITSSIIVKFSKYFIHQKIIK